MPIAVVGTWPQITTRGTESAMLSRTGVTILVAPGPEVTRATPTRPPARGKPGRHEARALFVGGHDQGHRAAMFLVIAENGVVYRQNSAAAVAENSVYTLVREDLDEHIGARHTGAGQRVGSLIQHVVTVFHPERLAVLAPGAQVPPSRILYGPCDTS